MKARRLPEWALVALILAAAAFFRFYLIQELPPGLHGDEAMNGNNAVEALHTGRFRVFYEENGGREGLFINMCAAAIALLGAEPWVLRATGALCGLLAVAGTYFAARELFPDRPRVPLVAAFLLATAFWPVAFSRIGFRANLAPVCLLWSLWALLRAWRTGSQLMALLGGALLGLGFHTYLAFRLAPLALLPLAGLACRQWRLTAIAAGGALVAAAPLAFYFSGHPEQAALRAAEVSLAASTCTQATWASNALGVLEMFHWKGDCNWRYNLACRPALLWPIGLAFLGGLGLALRARAWLLPWWLAVGLLPALATCDGVVHALSLRTVLAQPAAFLLAAVGLDALLDRRAWLRAVAAAAIVVQPAVTFRDYFAIWAHDPNVRRVYFAPYVSMGRYLRMLPDAVPKYVLVNYPGREIRGIPHSSQAVMFVSGTFVPDLQLRRNIRYLVPSELPAIAKQATSGVLIPLDLSEAIARDLYRHFPHARPATMADFWLLRLDPASP